ncbi:methyltransferase domain-containing protein [Virgibacillus sp. MSJ-26]|uniref:putative RNA methyltransferase n=1 Tax=Virgibacillus sp. MSJ-26 TaxID=2841522 RepID=UPI001C11F129|nr:methyltransferase domain-containing protein [Virgibacillus sp. MSJ-26]MBU5467023.1 methyltransferase domain-containing protein [Virgibacillus sp. MSJ-26]
MTNKEKSAKKLRETIDLFRCPICQSPIKVFDLKSLICPNNHTFDIAKQGYINMMTRPTNSLYDKKLFEARQQIITGSNLYTLLHDRVSKIIKEHLDSTNDSIVILDAGCGEGSHLQKVTETVGNVATTRMGLDVSKEGVIMAAKNYKDTIWLVGDLANTPIGDGSCQVILNIFSPANYMEFKRVLAPNGLVVKVVPRANYLKELREVFIPETSNGMYSNDETVSLFKKHFHSVSHYQLCYSKTLNQEDLIHLAEMSPLAWNAKKEQIDAFIHQDATEITVDLDILVGSYDAEGGRA